MVDRLLIFIWLVLGLGLVAVEVGIPPSARGVDHDELPVSVRGDPLGWRPTQPGRTGWHVILVPSGGGSGGGYDFGK